VDQTKLLKKVAKVLEQLNIPYIVTGGVAVTVWGRPRFTADIDIAIEISLSKSKDLLKALQKIDRKIYISEVAVNQAVMGNGEFNLIHPDGLKVDFWVLKNDIYARSRIKRRKLKKAWGQNISFISPDDLILSKLFGTKKPAQPVSWKISNQSSRFRKNWTGNTSGAGRKFMRRKNF